MSPFCKVTFKRAMPHGHSVTVTVCIKSDLMSLLFIKVTFVCVIEARGQTMSSELRVCSNYLIVWAWVLFLKQTNTSDVFKIVSRVDDKL